jgi:uncharacterized protein YndB with AHSA1/START domain
MIEPDKIHIQKIIEAPVSLVYSLWSVGENIPKWWSPNVREFPMTFTEGGSYRVVWSGSDDPLKQPYGVFTKIIPEKLIEMTWHWDSISADFRSNIRLLFDDLDGATHFDFIHENFNVPHEVKLHREAWEEIMNMLVRYVKDVTPQHQ